VFEMIIGVVGSIASGKGVVSSALEKKGFAKLVFSDILREELKKRGIELKRENFQELGDELRKTHGADYLARKLLHNVEDGKNYVMEGIRNPAEIKALREFKDTVIIGLEAPIEIRFQWIIMRNKENDPHSIEEVKKIDDRDNGKGEPEYGLHIEKCMKMVDYKIMNDGTREQLGKKINILLKKLNL